MEFLSALEFVLENYELEFQEFLSENSLPSNEDSANRFIQLKEEIEIEELWLN